MGPQEETSHETRGETRCEGWIAVTKEYRRDLDFVLQKLKCNERQSRERSIAITKIQEAIMWLGMDLKALNDGQSCYAEGYNPESTEVEPTAGGLKL